MSVVKNIFVFRQNRKKFLIDIKGGKCCICGFSTFNEALEFHHVNPFEKSFGLSDGNCRSLEKDISEVRKCALLCANCHRGVHAGILKLPEDWNFINEDLVEKALESKSVNYCLSCGKKINFDAKYCKNCSFIAARKVERPSRQQLKDWIRNFSFVQIGKICSVSDNTIRKWCKAYELPYRKTDIMEISDEDWEKL